MMKTVVLTGGCGFIASHTAVELLQQNYIVHLFENLSNSKMDVFQGIKEIVPGKEHNLFFHFVDLCNKEELYQVFESIPFVDAVFHFAGVSSISESIEHPLHYYETNITSSMNLLSVMKTFHCQTMLFSSSATVYGNSPSPLVEDTSLTGCGIVSPYGRTKHMIEKIMHDEYLSDPNWKMIILRCFNSIGAHHSGKIGEDPTRLSKNLMPSVVKVAGGELPHVFVYGNDFETPDGTGVRDYVHVMDLAEGHVAALHYTDSVESPFYDVFNLGNGHGVSVLEMLTIMDQIVGNTIPFQLTDRRPGDTDMRISDPSKSQRILQWRSSRTIETMCFDSWIFYQKQNTIR